MTSLSDVPAPSQGGTSGTSYFYVPKGTKFIGGHMPGRGWLRNPAGEVVMKFDKNGYVKIPVPKGMDGNFWKVDSLRGGNFLLLTVPPYFAPSPDKLLLPKEVIEKEKTKVEVRRTTAKPQRRGDGFS